VDEKVLRQLEENVELSESFLPRRASVKPTDFVAFQTGYKAKSKRGNLTGRWLRGWMNQQ